MVPKGTFLKYVTLYHISQNNSPKVRHTSELKNLNDCPASMCISELCMVALVGSIKLGLYCIAL